jgi:hypothetical protein
MKFALLSAVISLAFVWAAFAVLRPLFPAKPTPPFNEELMIVGDDSVMDVQENARYTTTSAVPASR